MGECHYQSGNYEAMVMAESVRQVLKMCGVNPERFDLEWASAAEGPRFVQLITDYCMKIKELGPLGEGEGEPGHDEIMKKLEVAVKAANNTKVRTAFGTLAKNLNKAGQCDEAAIQEGVLKKVVPAFEKQLSHS